jgi:hypothetical protein
MEFIFCKLPKYIKKNILLYDEHFIVRNGKIISIIPKTDYRYKLLNNITSTSYHIKKNDNTYVYRYFFQKFCNYFDGEIKNDEIIEIVLIESEDNIEYSFYIGRQYPKSIHGEFGKKQIYHHIENVLECCLHYTNFEFIRFNYVRR